MSAIQLAGYHAVEQHLVALRWDGELSTLRLPILERPYAGALAGNALILGTEDGRIYAIAMPEPVPANPAL